MLVLPALVGKNQTHSASLETDAKAAMMSRSALHSSPAMDIKEIVRDNEVRFAKYRHGFAYYTVRVPSEGFDYTFPVPLADIGDATLQATDKAIVFMHYMRKALEDGTFVRAR